MRISGKRGDSHSQEELRKRTSKVNVSVLRKRSVEGLVALWIAPAIEFCREMLSGKPELKPVMDALNDFKNVHADPAAYYKHKRLVSASEGPSSLEAYRQALPAWCAIKASKTFRQIHEGIWDKPLVGFLANPPKGGVPSITWKLISEGPMKEDIESLTKELTNWKDSLRVVAKPTPSSQAGGPSPQEGQAADAKKKAEEGDEAPQAEQFAKLKEQMASLASEVRTAYAAVVVQDAGAPARMRGVIEASTVAKRVLSDGGPSRLCFVYAVPCSWDKKRPQTTKTGRQYDTRSSRPTPLWMDDFKNFFTVVDPLVTAAGESVLAVVLGRCKRGGAGLLVEAGQTLANQVIEVAMKSQSEGAGKNMPPWRTKTITFSVAQNQGVQAMGVSGNLVEMIIFFLSWWLASKVAGADAR